MIHFDGLNILMSNGEHVPDWALYGSGAIIATALLFGIDWLLDWLRPR